MTEGSRRQRVNRDATKGKSRFDGEGGHWIADSGFLLHLLRNFLIVGCLISLRFQRQLMLELENLIFIA